MWVQISQFFTKFERIGAIFYIYMYHFCPNVMVLLAKASFFLHVSRFCRTFVAVIRGAPPFLLAESETT